MKITDGGIEREMTQEELDMYNKNNKVYELQAKKDEESKIQSELDNTDYKIIKTVEYIIVELIKKGSILLKGIDLPYDIKELSANRDQLRIDIENIRKELKESEDLK